VVVVDLNATKLDKMRVLNDAAMTRLTEELGQCYGVMVRLYETYAASDPNEDPFQLTWHDFRQLCIVSPLALFFFSKVYRLLKSKINKMI